jgi:hypothetical protein
MSYSGMALGGSMLLRPSRAAETHFGPYWLTIHAGGGWDPTMLCDPKGRAQGEEDPINNYAVDDIVDVGPFRVAPVGNNVSFFQRFETDLLVINGIDAQTVSHTAGTRHTWCGSVDPGTPAFSALAAAAVDPRPTLAFVSNGGYDETAGLVPPTRIPDVRAIEEIAYPDSLSASPDPATNLHSEATIERIKAARMERHERQRQAASLPRVRRAMSLLREARSGENELAALTEYLLSSLDNSNNMLFRQAQVAMACFRAGVSVSANLSLGGFDTHGNHDTNQRNALVRLLDGIAFAMDEAQRQGIADQLIIVVGSEFGRTPWYNDTNGKDHWSVTSMMMMGAGIEGRRVVGGTDEHQAPLNVDPDTLALDPGGIRITPAAIHAALREFAGFDGEALVDAWPMGPALPLFA